MSVINKLDQVRAKKRKEELKSFIMEIDDICDTLYERLSYKGVWETLLKLEDVRIRYYIEYYECENTLKGNKNA